MKPLRERMIEDLQLKGYGRITQKLYLSVVRQLCQHFNKPPERIIGENKGHLLKYKYSNPL